MDQKELKEALIKMRNAIQDYLDNVDMDSADGGKEKPRKDGKKDKEEDDG